LTSSCGRATRPITDLSSPDACDLLLNELDTESSREGGQATEPLTDKVAIVTGASKGIGRALALAFADAGASLVLAARGIDELERVAAEARKHGASVLSVTTDVTDLEQAATLVSRAGEEFGTVDILVNNVGAVPFLAPFAEIKMTGFEKYFRVNFIGAANCMQAVAPVLLSKRDGCVLNVASIAGFVASPALSYYASAKAALISLTETVALEWAPYNVRVNALAPGHIATGMNEEARETSAEFNSDVLAAIPLGRWGEPEDVTPAAVFLCSPAASFLTGVVLRVDGGQALSSLTGLVSARRLVEL
jgi:NAD(P)-dependent dehydrogenase (short-subunit alcohol dehydrogenase family)